MDHIQSPTRKLPYVLGEAIKKKRICVGGKHSEYIAQTHGNTAFKCTLSLRVWVHFQEMVRTLFSSIKDSPWCEKYLVMTN